MPPVQPLPMAGAVSGFIVQWRNPPASAEQTTPQRQASAVASRHALRLDRSPAIGWQRLAASVPLTAEQARQMAERLRADPQVIAVVPDVREQRQQVTPNDARYAEQWWLQARSASAGSTAANTAAAHFAQAWTRSTGAPVSGPATVVAVLDTGITSHPELNSRLLPGYDFVSNTDYSGDSDGRDNDPADPGDAITTAQRAAQPALYGQCPEAPLSSWHGTTVAGQLAAVSNNRDGVAAANWVARFVPVRVAGQCGASVSDIIDGLRWAAGLAVVGVPANANPARLVVLGYGGQDPCDSQSATPEIAATARLYEQVLAELRVAGTLVFVAAGNRRGAAGRPADCRGAIGVTAVNREGFKARYANFGSGIALATPGGDAATGGTCDTLLADGGIVSTGNLGDQAPGPAGYVAASGTSFAAPAAAAAASLMLAVNPALSADQVTAGLTASARAFPRSTALGDCSASNPSRCNCTTSTCGAGLLDADEALRYASDPAAYVKPANSPLILTGDRFDQCAALQNPSSNPPDISPTPPVVDSAGGSSGGGAMGAGWLLGLAMVVATLTAFRRPDSA